MTEASLLRRRAIAQEFVARVRAATVCEQCGRQPVEWHNPTHAEGRHNFRVAGLAVRGHPIEVIQAEMDASTPLCRSCHMAIDGRTDGLAASHPLRQGDIVVPPTPCETCGRLTKPRWRNRCRACYDAWRRSPRSN